VPPISIPNKFILFSQVSSVRIKWEDQQQLPAQVV